MCPACIATVTWMVVGATSAGGLGAVAVKKRRPRIGAKKIPAQSNLKKGEFLINFADLHSCKSWNSPDFGGSILSATLRPPCPRCDNFSVFAHRRRFYPSPKRFVWQERMGRARNASHSDAAGLARRPQSSFCDQMPKLLPELARLFKRDHSCCGFANCFFEKCALSILRH
jgi:hypothetical protein